MRSMSNANLQLCTFFVGVGLIAPMFAVAETREEWMARSDEEAQARRLAAQQRKQERLERAASQPSAAAIKRAEREARMADLKERREASAAAARSGKVPVDARPPAPPPQSAPRHPSQPSDTEMAALIQKHLDSTRNNITRAMVDRCNAGKPKDQEEQQYCRGWFDMERAKTGEPGKMRYDDVNVSSLTIRSCAPTTNAFEYLCFLNVRLNVPILQPAVAIAKVRRQGTGWKLLESSF